MTLRATVAKSVARRSFVAVISFRSKYIPPTNTSGTRIKVTASVAGECTQATLTVAWDYELDAAWNHHRAAQQLASCLGLPDLATCPPSSLRDGYRWTMLATGFRGASRSRPGGAWRVARCTRPGCTRFAPGESIGAEHTCDRCSIDLAQWEGLRRASG